jgi:hypothetical protein
MLTLDTGVFNDVYSGTSAGNTTSPESYFFNQTVDARRVKITITQPPTAGAQISEVDVFGPG